MVFKVNQSKQITRKGDILDVYTLRDYDEKYPLGYKNIDVAEEIVGKRKKLIRW